MGAGVITTRQHAQKGQGAYGQGNKAVKGLSVAVDLLRAKEGKLS